MFIYRERYTYIKSTYRDRSPFKAYEILHVILARSNESDLGSKPERLIINFC